MYNRFDESKKLPRSLSVGETSHKRNALYKSEAGVRGKGAPKENKISYIYIYFFIIFYILEVGSCRLTRESLVSLISMNLRLQSITSLGKKV